MDLQSLRLQIDEIDNELVRLFDRRMDICAKIAIYKRQNNLPVYDPKREHQKLNELRVKVKNEREEDVLALYSLLFVLSRAEQERI